MASIKKRDDGRWRARYRDASGKEHARHFARRVDAQTWLDGQTAAIVTGQHVAPKAGRMTVREYAATWERSQVGRAKTLNNTDIALRVHILPRLGDLPIGSVTRSDVQGLVKAMEQENKQPGTIRLAYAVLRRLFASAVDDRKIAITPCRKIALPRADDAEAHSPTVEQVAAIADTIGDWHRALVITLAGTGVRISEALALRVTDVDFLRRTVRVDKQRDRDGEIAPAKTPKSARTVPLAQVVVDELAAHLARRGIDSEWLFTGEHAEPLGYGAWSKIWRAAKTGLRTHDLRHFTASMLIAGGASVKLVQAVLGHSSPVVTLRTYAHLWPGDDDRARSVVDSTLGVLRTARGLDDRGSGPVAGQDG